MSRVAHGLPLALVALLAGLAAFPVQAEEPVVVVIDPSEAAEADAVIVTSETLAWRAHRRLLEQVPRPRNDSIGGPAIETPAWKREVVWRLFTENYVNPYYGGGHKQPGVWCDFSIGDVDFFFLDCRYYRTDPLGQVPEMVV